MRNSLQMYVRWQALASSMPRLISGLQRWFLPSVAEKMFTAFCAWAAKRRCSSWIMPLGKLRVRVRISRARPASPEALRYASELT
jgi:hypothetical protein